MRSPRAPGRIWCDLANSPHVLFFEPIIRRLRNRGWECELTARDFAQTLPLLHEYGLEATPIGAHTGRRRVEKGIRMLDRVRALAAFARGRGIDLAVGHNSYAQITAARTLGIPCATLMDYEHQPANHLAFRLAQRVIVPAAFPDKALRRFGVDPGRAHRYPGYKEEVYLAEFRPDPDFDAILSAAITPPLEDPARLAETPLVVLRPPAMFALYHGFENPLFDRLVARLADEPEALTIVVPRTEDQRRAVIDRKSDRLRLLSRSLRGLDLLARADVAISAGGTMNREAALLGTPAYTILAAPLGGVDRALIESGRMRQIRTEADIDAIRIGRRRDRGEPMADPRLADTITDLILGTLDD